MKFISLPARMAVAMASVAAGLVLVATPASAASPLCGGPASGSSTIQTTDGQTHRYYFRIPNTAVPAGGRPVLFWLHGDGGTGAPPTGSAFYPYTDPDGAIVVTPNGTNFTWTHASADLDGQPQDSQFISEIMDELDACAAGSIDKKYYVYGESRGAYMPYFLLQRSSTRNRIAGAGVNAGGHYCQDGDADCSYESSPVLHASPARIIHLHGTNDTEVTPVPLPAYGMGDDWIMFWPIRFWAHQNSCYTGTGNGDGAPSDNGVLKETYTANGHTARLYDLTGHGSACAKYQLILVNDGGHVIPNQEGRVWSFLHPKLPTLPTAPGTPSATPGDASAAVQWTDPGSFGNGTFTRWEVVNPANNAVVGTVANQSTHSANITGLSNFTSYTFKVRAVTSNGNGPLSGPSNSVTPTPNLLSTAGAFTPVTPARILDTRPGAGNDGAPPVKVQANGIVTIPVAAAGGVPPGSAAGAVVLNVTAVSPSAPGCITAYPSETTAPTVANLCFPSNVTIANHVTVKVGTDGKVNLKNLSGGPVDLVADVAGWYNTGNGTLPGTFRPATPARMFDTRAGSACAPKARVLGTTKLDVLMTSCPGGVPASGVGAVAMNLTVAGPAAAGFITGFPTDAPKPLAANVVFGAGQTIANAATLKVGSAGADAGKISFYNGPTPGSAGATDLVADLAGWFQAGNGTVAGAFKPLTPTRLMDTRTGTGVTKSRVDARSSVTLQVSGNGGVAAGAGAAVLNVFAIGAGAPGYVTAYPTPTTTRPAPTAANLVFNAGESVGNLVTVKLSDNGQVNFYNGSNASIDLAADVAGFYLK